MLVRKITIVLLEEGVTRKNCIGGGRSGTETDDNYIGVGRNGYQLYR